MSIPVESCRHRHKVLDRERVCVRDAGHPPPHEDATGATWIVRREIDATGYAALGDYIDEHHIGAGEEGVAVAAWLHQRIGWDGQVERIDDPDDEPTDVDEPRADP